MISTQEKLITLIKKIRNFETFNQASKWRPDPLYLLKENKC